MSKILTGLLPFLVIGVLAVIAIAISIYLEKKRRQALEKVAADLGLEFFPQGIPGLPAALQGFQLFSSGRGHAVTNTIRGVTDEVELTIFDLTYTTGSGKNSHTHRQTIIRFYSAQLGLPDFTISPEGFFQKIAKFFGTKDINFDEDPRFSSSFILQGGHEGAVRQLFTQEVRDWFSQRTGTTAAGRGHELFFFRAEQRVKPEKIADLLGEGLQFFKLVASPVSEGTPRTS